MVIWEVFSIYSKYVRIFSGVRCDRDRQRETDRQTDRQADRQTDRQRKPTPIIRESHTSRLD